MGYAKKKGFKIGKYNQQDGTELTNGCPEASPSGNLANGKTIMGIHHATVVQ